MRGLRVTSTSTSPRMPALPHLGWLAAAVALIYVLARWLVLALRPTLLVALVCAVMLAALLAWQRMALTLFSPTLAGLALACGALALLARRLLPGQHAGPIIALALLAFALRAGGMLHPHAIFSDHLLHANNLLQVGLGDVYFTEGLPASRGGGDAPYPPGLYLLLAPALTLVPTDMHSRALVVQLGVALLDSLVLVLFWFLLRRAGLGQRAALSGAALYLLPPPIMASFSIGEYANLGGQILALPVLALLAVGRINKTGEQEPGTRSMLSTQFAILLCLGLLSHLGVAISLVLVLLTTWLLSMGAWLAAKARGGNADDRLLVFSPAALTIGGMLATAFAAVFFYSAPEFTALYAERLARNTAAPATQQEPFLAASGRIVLALFTPGSRLLPLTLVTGLVGLLLLWQHGGGRLRHTTCFASFRLTLLAWWVGVLLSLGLLLVAQQGVRWQHFLYPALCLGGGAALAALWRRGRAGRVVSLISLFAIVSHGLIMWVWQIYDYLH
jgi:hypothetical protein